MSSFVFFGGCRSSKGDLDPVGNPSSANLPELQQLFRAFADVQTPEMLSPFWSRTTLGPGAVLPSILVLAY